MGASMDGINFWKDYVIGNQSQPGYSKAYSPGLLASARLDVPKDKPARGPDNGLPEEIIPAIIIAQIEQQGRERQERLRRQPELRIEDPNVR